MDNRNDQLHSGKGNEHDKHEEPGSMPMRRSQGTRQARRESHEQEDNGPLGGQAEKYGADHLRDYFLRRRISPDHIFVSLFLSRRALRIMAMSSPYSSSFSRTPASINPITAACTEPSKYVLTRWRAAVRRALP